MANINLYQNNEVEEGISQEKMVDIGMISAVVVFVIVLLAYGGVFLYQRSLQTKIEGTKNEIMEWQSKLKQEDVNLAASIQQRLDLMSAKKDSFVKDNPGEIFLQLQKVMVKGAVVSDFVYSAKSIDIKLVADDMAIAAKQVASFKSSPFFSGAVMKSISVAENKKVNIEVTAAIQN